MTFHNKLKLNIHSFIKIIYTTSKKFPKEEIYGITSQIRRAAMSVMLNYIEGYARRKSDTCKVYRNFLEISYGSLKETKYLIYFCFTEKYLDKKVYDELIRLNDEIGKMLWSILQNKK